MATTCYKAEMIRKWWSMLCCNVDMGDLWGFFVSLLSWL